MGSDRTGCGAGAGQTVTPEELVQWELGQQQLFDLTRDAIFVADGATGELLDGNRAAQKMIGRTLDELRGMPMTGLFPDEDAALARETFALHMCEPGRHLSEMRVLHRDGHLVPVEISATGAVDLGQRTINIGTFRDVSQRKRDEQVLRFRLALQETISRIAADMIRLPATEIDGAVERALRSLGELAGVARTDLWMVDGSGRAHLIHEWRADPTESAFLREVSTASFPYYAGVIQRGEVIRVGQLSDLPPEATKERAWAAMYGFQPRLIVPLFSHETLYGTLGVYGRPAEEREWAPELVSLLETAGAILLGGLERRRAEYALRASEQRLARIVETSPVGICLVDPAGRITFANSTAERILGLSCKEIGARTYDAPEWIHGALDGGPFPAEQLPVARVLATGEAVFGVEHTIEHDSKRTAISVNATPLRDEGGTLQAVVAAFSDISERVRQEEERRRLEEQIRHAQKLESLGVLAGGIAHDFNNLLVGILGNLDLALSELPPSSPAREHLREAEVAARRTAELTQQMLAYSGKGRFCIESLDLGRVVEEMVHLLQASISKKVVLRFDLASLLPPVEADATQLRQVIMNLVINAAEAIGEQNGVIALSTGAMTCDRATLAETWLDEGLAPGTYVFLDVADTGCGMETATYARIFEPFFTTKFTGRGLGLPAVLGIVRGHRGAIKINSAKGKGTTFRVLLPAGQKPVEASLGNAAIGEWRTAGLVLLVDDEDIVRDVAKKMIERLGLTVLLARDGREALRVFRERGAEISVVLLDLTMPQLDGEETFRELRRLQEDIKVILTSGYSEQVVEGRFSGLGLAGFIQKPFRLETLRAKLREVFGG